MGRKTGKLKLRWCLKWAKREAETKVMLKVDKKESGDYRAVKSS